MWLIYVKMLVHWNQTNLIFLVCVCQVPNIKRRKSKLSYFTNNQIIQKCEYIFWKKLIILFNKDQIIQ